MEYYSKSYSSKLKQVRECNSRLVYPDYIAVASFLFFTLVYTFFWVSDICTNKFKDFQIEDFFKFMILRKLKVWFHHLLLIIFYDNLLHFVTSVAFIKSSLFGAGDFVILVVRSFVVSASFFFLQNQKRDKAEFTDFLREVKSAADPNQLKSKQNVILGVSFHSKKRFHKIKAMTINLLLKGTEVKETSKSTFFSD